MSGSVVVTEAMLKAAMKGNYIHDSLNLTEGVSLTQTLKLGGICVGLNLFILGPSIRVSSDGLISSPSQLAGAA